MIRVVLLVTLVMLGGCSALSGRHPESGVGETSQDDEDYKNRQKCQETSEGSQSKTVCY